MLEELGLPREIRIAPGTKTTDREEPVDAHAPHVVGDAASERFDANDIVPPLLQCLPSHSPDLRGVLNVLAWEHGHGALDPSRRRWTMAVLRPSVARRRSRTVAPSRRCGMVTRHGGLGFMGIGKFHPDVSDPSTDPALQMLSDGSLELLRPFEPKLPVHLLCHRDKEVGNRNVYIHDCPFGCLDGRERLDR